MVLALWSLPFTRWFSLQFDSNFKEHSWSFLIHLHHPGREEYYKRCISNLLLLSLRSEDPFMALTWSGRLNIKAMRSATAKFVIKSLSGDNPPQPCFKLKPRRIKFAVIPKKHANPKTTFCPINPSHSELVNSVISMQMLRSLLSGSSCS